MPRTRSGKEHDPVKREEERKRAEQMRQYLHEAHLRHVAKETEEKAKEQKKKVLTHLKSAVTKKQKVGSIKLRKLNGGRKTRRHRRA